MPAGSSVVLDTGAVNDEEEDDDGRDGIDCWELEFTLFDATVELFTKELMSPEYRLVGDLNLCG